MCRTVKAKHGCQSGMSRMMMMRRYVRNVFLTSSTTIHPVLSTHIRISAVQFVRRRADAKVRLRGEVHRLIAPRDQKYQSNFVEVSFPPLKTGEADNKFRSDKIVYRRYAGLFFCCCVDSNDNELAYLEAIHLFVEVLGESAL
jgi:AP-2 complex subunit sigma-1